MRVIVEIRGIVMWGSERVVGIVTCTDGGRMDHIGRECVSLVGSLF